jgi:small-conductance mechanosensitive channel
MNRRSHRARCAGPAAAMLCMLAFASFGAEAPAKFAPAVTVGEPTDLVIANRTITSFRADIYGATTTERARSVRERILSFVEYGGHLTVATKPVPEGAAVLVGDRIAFRILEEDLEPDSTQTTEEAALEAAQRLDVALNELAESRDARVMLPAVGVTILGTALAAALIWGLIRLRRWFVTRIERVMEHRTDRLVSGWAGHVIGRGGIVSLVTLPVRVLIWLLGVLIAYEYVGLVLRQFPYTRPWGEALQGNLLEALGRFGTNLLRALPGLLFVVLIFSLARLVVRVVRAFFARVQAGRVKVTWVDETTAHPTERLATVLIWLFALVAAYPYIPGSGSEAFKGVGVFVGLMLSIGSSGIVNQAVSGLMLMYTRSLKTGEFVRIGEMEGTVSSVGFLTTRLETLRREEITIPNSVIASSVMRNFSRLAVDGNLQVGTQVTIGYDTPWRQVHAMLLEAAKLTSRIAETPPPFVLQTNLHDFYVEYTLVVPIAVPRYRVSILSELHSHIQDVFNKYGVQIMSPNYEADPEQAKVVNREDWFKAPATSETQAESAIAEAPRQAQA